ncbi:MAG: hypothetical protein ACXVEF_00210 [Polyangiales bacterium]
MFRSRSVVGLGFAMAACAAPVVREPPKCPPVASAPPAASAAATASSEPVTVSSQGVECTLEEAGELHPGCRVALPLTDERAAYLARLPDAKRWVFTLAKATDAELASIAKAPFIERLVLREPKLESLDALSALPSLSSLTVEGGSVRSLVALRKRGSMRSLRLENVETSAKSLSEFAPEVLEELRVVALPAIEALGDLGAQPLLRVLTVRDSTLNDSAAIGKFVELRELDLEDTKGITKFDFLRPLVAMQVLRLGGLPIASLVPLEKMTVLERLDLDRTKASDLAPLASMKLLRWVRVDRSMPMSKRKAYAKSLPRVTIVNRPGSIGPGLELKDDGTCIITCRPGDVLCYDLAEPTPCPKSAQ